MCAYVLVKIFIKMFIVMTSCLENPIKGKTEDEMAGWHHRLNGHKFEYTPGVGDG